VLAFLQARLTPGGYFGLHLTIGVLVLALGVWGFTQVVDELREREWRARADTVLAEFLNERASPGVTRVMLAITALGAPGVVLAVSAVMAVAMARQRDAYGVMGIVLAVPAGLLVNTVIKHTFDRGRPTLEPILTLASGFSFPSGHTAGATLLYGFLAVHLARRARDWNARAALVVLALLVIGLVAMSRVYLAVHYLTDVLAAMAGSAAWLAIALTGVESLRIARERRMGGAAAISG
jgi:membrane-associated phospholipid phosphatase